MKKNTTPTGTCRVHMTEAIGMKLHSLTTIGSVYMDSLLVLIEGMTVYASLSEEPFTQEEINAMSTAFDLHRVLKAITNQPRDNPNWDIKVESFALSLQDELGQLSGKS